MGVNRTVNREIRPNETVTEAVTNMMCSAENCEVTSLPPLTEAINPDAMNNLFASQSDQMGHVSFIYNNYRITVDNGEYITVEPVAKSRMREYL